MGIRKLATLIGKELLHGPRGFILVMVIAAPLLITLVINLALGNLFSGIPQLAVYSEGTSQFISTLEEYPQIESKLYSSMDSLKDAVERGAADMGIVLPDSLDNDIANGKKTTVMFYVWGESLAKDRLVVTSTVMQAARDFTNQPEPIILESVTLGEEISIPWSQRLMPLTVMMAVFFGGLMIPAVSLINEKQKRTLQALVATPTSIINILLAKGIVGALLSIVNGNNHPATKPGMGQRPGFLVAYPHDSCKHGFDVWLDFRHDNKGYEHPVCGMEIRRRTAFRPGNHLYVSILTAVARVLIPDLLHSPPDHGYQPGHNHRHDIMVDSNRPGMHHHTGGTGIKAGKPFYRREIKHNQ